MKNNLAQSLELQPNDLPALKKTENLPFTIRIAQDAESMEKAVRIRREAYGRHLPELAANMTQPDDADFAPGTTVLLAESKFDGGALGTIRIHTNDFASLPLEKSVGLPEYLQNVRAVEALRLGVKQGRVGSFVKLCLFKALYLFCLEKDYHWILSVARKPLDEDYEKLLFEDIGEAGKFMPIEHVWNLPHRVMRLNVLTAQDMWLKVRHPLLPFMTELIHPDIKPTIFQK